MGGAFSIDTASTTSRETSNSAITQQYAGTCNITCNNSISGINETYINSIVGDINLTQACSANGTCLMDNSMGAVTDITFAAQNSTAARAALGAFNINTSNAKAYQTINQIINQSVSQTCDVGTTNQMSDIDILAINSSLGDVTIGQSGSSVGNCSLNSAMNAQAIASGTMNNCTTAGKGKQCSKGKGSVSIGQYIIYAVIIFAAILFISILVRVFKGSSPTTTSPTSPTSTSSLSSIINALSPSSSSSSSSSSLESEGVEMMEMA